MLLSAGTRLGPYEILSPLGAGGMGEVYMARDTRLDRNVAIKVAAERFSERFSKEARAIAALNHPHICTLYDVGPNYLVMEYIEGETLAALVSKGPLLPDHAMKIAIEVAQALDAAHRHGVVHRDLKPGNIMLAESGPTKLLDFGLAQFHQMPAADDRTDALTNTGQVVGTLRYMSPEQLEGKEVDPRSDIFAFGAVLYEMLTGQAAFERGTTAATITAVTRDQPKPISDFVRAVPNDLQAIILRCMRKAREERYASSSDVAHQLEKCRALASEPVSGINLRVLLQQSKRPRVAVPALLILVLLAGLSAWWIDRIFKARWARTEALPHIAQLVEQEKSGEAFDLAVRAEKYISGDPQLAAFWPKISWFGNIHTTPPGAAVFRRSLVFGIVLGNWSVIPRSRIAGSRGLMPNGDSSCRAFLRLSGRRWLFFGRFVIPGSLSVTMDPDTTSSAGMVHQTEGVSMSGVRPLKITPASLFGLPGFEDVPEIMLGDYWLDRYETTNKQFKEFLDKGGYQKPEYWKHGFRKGGRLLSWQAAMQIFRDTTGRPGPATWVQGEYPRGQEDFPVTGVSWYEAAAYAEWAGKALPTVYHWATAASPWASASILPASNFSGQGPARVGTFRGMSWFGAYDMGGNVKEWCLNEADPGKRYILGGAWDEPLYMFNNADARSEFERSSNFGFRCAKYSVAGMAARATDPLALRVRDFNLEKPVSDELFRVYKSLYSYDKTPLRAAVESVDNTGEWKREKISFAAAYGNERVLAYLFLPKKVAGSLPDSFILPRLRTRSIFDPAPPCPTRICSIS